MGIYEAASF